MKWNKPGHCLAALLVGSLSLIPPFRVQGAFLQLGPFPFDATTRFEAIATSNVEQERKSEATDDREDFYLVWGLDLTTTAEMMPRARVSLDTGITIEEHINRPDLNNSESPFGRFNGTIDADWDPLVLNGGVRWERTSESVEDKFVPVSSGLSRKKRQIGTTTEYTWGAQWLTERLELGLDYTFTQERYDAEEYEPEEQDEESFNQFVYLKLGSFMDVDIGLRYEVETSQTEMINEDTGPEPEEKTETATLELGSFEVLGRFDVTLNAGMQREHNEGEKAEWEKTYGASVATDWEMTPTLRLTGSASYDYEENPEEDDISFQYDVTLQHELSRRVTHSLSFTREPRDTIGANEDTDTTTYAYDISVADFLLPNVEATASVQQEIDRPVDGDEEETWTYNAGLTHSTAITPRLTRQLAYTYDLEDSNQEDELLEEHRITLSFILSL